MDTGTEISTAQERELLDAARAGDENAFRRLIEPYQPQLHAHCYRMLGSVQDAEDALQETLLRAWSGLGGFEAGRPLRPWLYRIATNACLDAISHRRKRILPLDGDRPANAAGDAGEPLVEAVWVEPYPDERLGLEDGFAAPHARYEQREAVELAFIAALQHLPARQRSVLILREVLGFSAAEVAEFLETTAVSVNSALQRARKGVEERLPARSQQATLRSLGDEQLTTVVENYIRAWESRDVDAIVAMLVEDAVFAMPPHPNWWHGRDAVIEFITSTGVPPLRHVLTRANGQVGVAWYLLDAAQEKYVPVSLEVLAFDGARVREIIAFASPEVFGPFGLPDALPA
jgi:RNA polymerase sigma-70 factor (ECF subfamily)